MRWGAFIVFRDMRVGGVFIVFFLTSGILNFYPGEFPATSILVSCYIFVPSLRSINQDL